MRGSWEDVLKFFMIQARCAMTSSLTRFCARISPTSLVFLSVDSTTRPMVFTCWDKARNTMTRCEAWMALSLPYSRSRAVTNCSISRLTAPWIEAMSSTGVCSFFSLALATTSAWWCRWNSSVQETKLRSMGRPNSRTDTCALLEDTELRRRTTKAVKDVCMSSSKNLLRPFKMPLPKFLAESRELRTCGFSWLWSRTEPSSKSTKNGSWNMFRLRSVSRSRNSRRQMEPPLLTCVLWKTEVVMPMLPCAVRVCSAVPKRAWREAWGIRSLESAASRAMRSARARLCFSVLFRFNSSGSRCVQRW
mmetsp:Transcript_56685/g.181987  ORF Transcript_56685/g.181987 Transcript_56685/m.181987 type:complete len:305 (+) Transcript_56685:1346-2260(+)